MAGGSGPGRGFTCAGGNTGEAESQESQHWTLVLLSVQAALSTEMNVPLVQAAALLWEGE